MARAYVGADKNVGDDTNLFHAVSYGWATKEHPDPERFHLATLAPAIKARLAIVNWASEGRYPKPKPIRPLGRPAQDPTKP